MPTQAPERIHDTLADLVVDIDTLKPYGRNPRRGDIDAIAESLRVNGQYRPIVANLRTSEVLAGNHTLLAAKHLGWRRIAATYVDVDEHQAAKIVAVDNRANDLAGYDDELLAALLADLPDLDGTAYTQDDLDALLGDGPGGDGNGDGEGSGDEDDAPEPPAEPVSVSGDMWLLGPHRLLCGDSTNPDDLARLVGKLTPGIVYTDPPYGISIVKSDGTVGNAGGYMPVAGDETTDAARDAFALLTTAYPNAWHIWWGDNHYAGSARLPDASCWLVWDKENGATHFADCELAWTNHPGAVRMFRHMWNGAARASERGKRDHPTQKPVALARWAFELVDPKGDQEVVLDVFGGSGSTLLAANDTGRIALVMEREPAYVDVICRRYQERTGKMPVLEATGEPHDFIAG